MFLLESRSNDLAARLAKEVPVAMVCEEYDRSGNQQRLD
jgi:hypothetical protein